MVGIEVILKCPQQSSGTVVWNVKLNNGTRCYISYDSEENRAERNCSKNMDWLSRHDRKSDYSLHIQPLQIFNDGLYVCSVSTNNGTFIYNYALTVLGKKLLLLFLTYRSSTDTCSNYHYYYDDCC